MAKSASHVRTGFLIRIIVLWLGFVPLLATTGLSAAEPPLHVPDALTLDLPAMALTVDDYPIADLEYEPGMLWGIDQQALALSSKIDEEFPDTRDVLADLGWRGRYVAPVSIVNEEDRDLADIYGGSSITEFATEDGAIAGFELPGLEDGTSIREIDAPAVGNQSKLYEVIHDHRNERSWFGMVYTFQTDRMVATITLAWFDDAGYEPFDAATMAETAATFLQRIESVLNAHEPALYLMNLRPAADASIPAGWREEFFRVQNGVSQPMWDLSIADRRQARRNAETYGIIDEYLAQSFFGAETGEGEYVTAGTVVSTILTFASKRAARNFVDEIVDVTIDHPGFYETIEELDDLPDFDGATSGFSYDISYGSDTDGSGYRIFVQIDTRVISIELDAIDGVAADDVSTLVEAQLDCISDFSGDMCDPFPVAAMISGE